MKVIHDSVHGSIKLEDGFIELLSTAEMQRLASIRQLGLGYLVFPGANHTRLEHSIGTYHIASMISDAIGLDKESKEEVMAAAMLHDVGHAPFSHTLEVYMKERYGIDHMDTTQKLITGELHIKDQGIDVPHINEVLESMGMDPEHIASMIKEDKSMDYWPAPDKENIKASIIHGPIDADQLDYLMRDAHYTGVAHGTIDIERLMQTIMIRENRMVIDRSGVPAAEGILVARALMYSSVYFHRTVRIAEMMLNKAIRLMGIPLEEFQLMTDCDLMEMMKSHGGFPRKMAFSILFRRLYKKAFWLELSDLTAEEKNRLIEWADKADDLEKEIAERSGISEEYVLVDIPGKDILISEPRMHETEVIVWEGGCLRPLSRYSTLPRALKRRWVHRWGILVATPEKYVEKVRKSATYIFYNGN